MIGKSDHSLILLRGLPGSGKSTLAEVLSENGKYPVLSVDHYFINEEGKYDFNYRENYLAYDECKNNARKELMKGTEKIFIDNTFTQEWEMEPYFKMAEEFIYRIFVITVENRHGGKNIHRISEEQIHKMAEKYKVQLLPL
jgi:predicted kinase